MKLTPLRRECLEDLLQVDGYGFASPYELGQPTNVFVWLSGNGLAEVRPYSSHSRFTEYRITDAGRAALAARKEEAE